MSILIDSDSPKRVSIEPYTWSKSLISYTRTQKLDATITVDAYSVGKEIEKRPSLDSFDQTLSEEVIAKLDKKEDNDINRD